MPMTATYPDNWREFSRHIREERAGNRCECTGECGLHREHPGPRRCSELNGKKAAYAKGRVVLTVAHLCNCSPPCANEAHVKAMCNRCHLRVDVKLHVRHRTTNRMRKKEAAGQAALEFK